MGGYHLIHSESSIKEVSREERALSTAQKDGANCQPRKEEDIVKTSCTAEPQALPTRIWDPTWVAVTIGRWAVRYGVKD